MGEAEEEELKKPAINSHHVRVYVLLFFFFFFISSLSTDSSPRSRRVLCLQAGGTRDVVTGKLEWPPRNKKRIRKEERTSTLQVWKQMQRKTDKAEEGRPILG